MPTENGSWHLPSTYCGLSAILPQAIVINQQRVTECNLPGGGRYKNFLRKSKQTKKTEMKKDNRDD